ncbi:MAG: hypothetical protein ACUBOA_15195 [Candidatus Loosdrechtia sp.]|uniref:hypothetical protein n=1 Tax=Candidatus Loosdrechtia sp. TaxID=3101272 RepID=UPI003A6FCFFC|nr:MAG: hypothetical protein QY305_01640 [Candidatus Jettenia sp. AMX2]
MGYKVLFAIMIGTIVLGTPGLSNAFNIILTSDQIHEANNYGRQYKGPEIFYSDVVRPACFGDFPKGPGGVVMSKYINVAVTSAMKALKDEILTDEEMQEIQDSTAFKVVVNITENIQSPEDVQILLIQGSNKMVPMTTEAGMKYKDKRQDVIGFFPYDMIDTHTSTTTSIIVNIGDDQKEYKVDFSEIK